jgi:hypothetical protein
MLRPACLPARALLRPPAPRALEALPLLLVPLLPPALVPRRIVAIAAVRATRTLPCRALELLGLAFQLLRRAVLLALELRLHALELPGLALELLGFAVPQLVVAIVAHGSSAAREST